MKAATIAALVLTMGSLLFVLPDGIGPTGPAAACDQYDISCVDSYACSVDGHPTTCYKACEGVVNQGYCLTIPKPF